ncbi:Ribonuclease 3,ribonuclease III,ribonuclease III,RNase3 domain [Chlamydia serpentis]|uniref:Ribonuclease 3 n=1 Tax=Chlamydia serpentis TaxID=1967782 RepID=A0A2R8F9X6_9CHLA|nr:ribonuclease III [Chlamydia serpentis]SPN73225.1 Ribonuclease 3,ribonuclease III,ribonuclease III,RNase3 domain [Chlamydia serpentis]
MHSPIDIKAIEAKLNFTFTQFKLLETALTHPSYKNESSIQMEDSERLEFLGDAVLGLIVTEHLFLLFPAMDEGTLSTARACLVNATACYRYTITLGIGEYLLIGKGEKIQSDRGRLSAYANLFEAILGAIYLDGGLSPARKLTVPLLPAKEEILPLMSGNPKNLLQQFTQKHFRILPIYQSKVVKNAAGIESYQIQVIVNNQIWGEGHALSKKEAEKIAAKQALDTHGNKTENTVDM